MIWCSSAASLEKKPNFAPNSCINSKYLLGVVIIIIELLSLRFNFNLLNVSIGSERCSITAERTITSNFSLSIIFVKLIFLSLFLISSNKTLFIS